MNRFTDVDLSLSEIQKIALEKKAKLLASELQQPVLILARELYRLPYIDEIKQRFSLYLKSPYDSHFTLVNQFYKLDDFCLWYVSRHPYREFELINYSQI